MTSKTDVGEALAMLGAQRPPQQVVVGPHFDVRKPTLPGHLEGSYNGKHLTFTRTHAAVTLGDLLENRAATPLADPLLKHDANAY
jgi:hypothetical protein